MKQKYWLPYLLILLAVSAVYLPFIGRLGYFNDDWYLMYAAGVKGAGVFKDIYAVDRPLRAWVMGPAYLLFGPNPIFYNLSGIFFKLVAACGLLDALRNLWPRQRVISLLMTLLFIIYPGFLSQFNGIDYQAQMVSLAAGLFSLAFSIRGYQATTPMRKAVSYGLAAVLAWFYLGLVEYFIGLEFVKILCVLLLIAREVAPLRDRICKYFRNLVFLSLGFLPFLIWRLMIFESGRGATDVEVRFDLGAVLSSPLHFFAQWSSTLLDDGLDVIFRAWGTPLHRLSTGMTLGDWFPEIGIAMFVIFMFWLILRSPGEDTHSKTDDPPRWKREAILLGLGAIICGLLPVILVGRSVDFRSFSRYSLMASVGVVILWPAALSLLPAAGIRNLTLSILVLSAALTHFVNGLNLARQTEAVRSFWWQVSWRIPQMDIGTTLISHYNILAEEDYFVWGPANLIYYPGGTQARYVQPGVYAALLNDETISKVLAQEPQEFSNRRSIRTYPNYRNILILTQPTPDSCLQVVDGNQVVLSSQEDTRISKIASYSEVHHIWLELPFHKPAAIPFGSEPEHGWCFFYEKASYARMTEDWEQIVQLGEQAHNLGYSAKDMVEWLPFLEAYSLSDNTQRLDEIFQQVREDPGGVQQTCRVLSALNLKPATRDHINRSFCISK